MSLAPGRSPGGTGGREYSVNVPVFGFIFPKNIRLSSVYHGVPAESRSRSCATVSGRGMSYWVIMTRVALPVGRGSVFNSKGHVVLPPLRLTVARYSASSFFGIPKGSRPHIGFGSAAATWSGGPNCPRPRLSLLTADPSV